MIVESSAIIHILNGTLKGKKITELYADQIIATTAICLHEVLVGVTPRERPLVLDFFRGLEILPFDTASAYGSAELAQKQKRKGKTLGELDVFIASIALAHDLLLITTDKDFLNVEGLKVVLV